MPDPEPIDVRVLDTGYCLAWEHHLLRGGRRRRVECHSTVALFRHPRAGWVLYDTGYAPRLVDCTERFPWRLYRWATPLVVRPEYAAAAQLARLGVDARDVAHVVVSHFHADHLAGLRDFPRARFWARRSAWTEVAGSDGLAALRRAFVPALVPDDFERRCELLPALEGPELADLGPTHDLFGDGTLRLVDLPGHARGQLGLLARTGRGPLLFVADACWVRDGYRLQRPPHWITRVITDDAAERDETLARLADYARREPSVSIVPTHCPEAFREHAEVIP
ncbi:MAG: MBL fold metallo-hydrolase [Planctomycetes bacterium]|nr:MBL fold metallo-hydrolase [Planctomycetota bacterium]